MSQVIVASDLMKAAATDLAAIGSTLEAARSDAAVPTLAIVPAAADEVSAGIAQLFAEQGEDYQKAASAAAAYHEEFVQNVTTSAGAYASAESVNFFTLIAQTVAGSVGSYWTPFPTSLNQLLNAITGTFVSLFVGLPVVILLVGLVNIAPAVLEALVTFAGGLQPVQVST